MTESSEEFDVRLFLRVLWARKWTILMTALFVGGVAMSRALLTTPVYAAAVEVAVEPPASGINSQVFGNSSFTDQEIETQRRLATSEQVAERVVERLALPDSARSLRGSVVVSIVSDSRVLLIIARNADPQRAALLAQTFGEEYLALRQSEALDRLVESTAALEEHSSSIRARLDAIEATLATSEDASEIAELDREQSTLRNQLASVQGSLGFLDVGASLLRGGGVILANATVPTEPIEPQPVRSTTMGVLLGLLLGAGLAFATDRFNDRIDTEQAVASAAPGISILGRIPWHEEAINEELITLVDPGAPASEAYRSMRTQLRFVAGAGSSLKVAITSAVEAEGKSTVAANYAVATAQAGYRTVLIDADLRQPRVHELFGVPNNSGLSHVLTAQASVGEVSLSPMPALTVMTSGPRPPNPSELLGSQQFADLIDDLTGAYDVIILDSAPLLPVADGYEVASVADATVLVAHVHHSRRRALRDAVAGLGGVGARIAGVVLTAIDPRDSVYEQYYYRAAEGAEPAAMTMGRRQPRPIKERSEEALFPGDR